MSTSDGGMGLGGGLSGFLPGGLEELVRRLSAGVPPLLDATRKDVELHFRRVLQEQLARLDLCSRSEFEAQGRVLERLQRQLAEAEARLVALEQQAQAGARLPPAGGPRS